MSDRPFVSNAEQRRHEHLSASKPTSADRVSDRLNELTAENARLEQEVRELQAELLALNVPKAEAEARKPYAHKILALEEQLREAEERARYWADIANERQGIINRLTEDNRHLDASLVTARQERDAYHDRIVKARAKLDPFT